MGDDSPPAEAAYFEGFFTPTFQYNGQTFVNHDLMIQAPYTPSRTVYSAFLWQANDPLIHYLASDLDSQVGAPMVWFAKPTWLNGVWGHIDNQLLPIPPISPVGGRYQPWGQSGQMADLPNGIVDVNSYNLSYKDALVWRSDYWNFPTNLMQSLPGLGQVHRGTPWQTFFLKSTNILQDASTVGPVIGLNTWMAWTGDYDQNDAVLMAPVYDWALAGLLMSLLNTNDPIQLFSVNDPNVADWQNLMNGLVAYSNSAPVAFAGMPPEFDTYVMSSNSPQVLSIASAIVQAHTNLLLSPPAMFYSIGNILATAALSGQSPFLNLTNTIAGPPPTSYGIADWEYEAIPAQLLPLLRPDSIGTLTPTNGAVNLQFSGADGYCYALQSSTNLTDWVSVSTNQPVQGSFSVPVGPAANSQGQFYRTVLLP
jgi:hypothetical protein